MASHLPRTTFCWLPPERFTTGRSMDGVFTRKRATSASATRRSRARSRNPSRPDAGSAGSEMFAATLIGSTSPWRLRSSGAR